MNSLPAQAAAKQPEQIEISTPLPSLITPTARIESIRKELLETKYSVCLERPALMEEFKKTSDGRKAKSDHPLIRRAKTIAYLLSHRTPKIYENELIIGNMTSKRMAANYYPEGGSINILEDFFRLGKRQIPIYLKAREKIQLAGIGIKTGLTSARCRLCLWKENFLKWMPTPASPVSAARSFARKKRFSWVNSLD